MEKLFDYIKLLVIALGTGFTWLFGVWDIPLSKISCLHGIRSVNWCN